jgi:hypothetical protein
MAKYPQSVKTAEVQDDILPAGDYLAEAIKTEFKETKSGTGQYLSIAFKILEGSFKDRLIYTNLNVINDNPVAVNIAVGSLKKIYVAAGKNFDTRDDSDEILHIPMILTLTVRPEGDAYPGNEIKKYAKVGASGAAPKKNPFAKK